ncbi:MAG: hypothetical protein ISS26_08285 [Candidatus Omnitrophica bacterium]|nr:hypothetical protein [Candidatus Omnitrophota bacterium]
MNLEKYLRPAINRKIIRFFLENPSSIDNSRGIATWINENVSDTDKALKKLAIAKILVSHGSDATSAYGYTADPRIASNVRACLENFKD